MLKSLLCIYFHEAMNLPAKAVIPGWSSLLALPEHGWPRFEVVAVKLGLFNLTRQKERLNMHELCHILMSSASFGFFASLFLVIRSSKEMKNIFPDQCLES